MALTVETGSNVANADAFVSLADCDAYHASKGNATWTGVDANKENAIRRATQYLSDVVMWNGYRTHGRRQKLAWPRSSCFDVEGYGILSDEIPEELKTACYELALQELLKPGILSPAVVRADAVKREKLGELETEYTNPLASAAASIPGMPLVQALIAPFVSQHGSGSELQGTAYR